MQILETQEQITARIVKETATEVAKVVSEAAQAAALVLAKENNSALTTIAVLQNEMKTMKEQYSEVNKKLDDLSPKFEKIYNKINEIAAGKPTWAVTIIITILSTLCGSLIIFTVTNT